mmetsp:Transcript_27206/g.62777  ORF Transcript_27206/g.62777 Transcript_27206/m.62777 type:complete len:108 (-) Transcript_27206:5476-5799(-)
MGALFQAWTGGGGTETFEAMGGGGGRCQAGGAPGGAAGFAPHRPPAFEAGTFGGAGDVLVLCESPLGTGFLAEEVPRGFFLKSLISCSRVMKFLDPHVNPFGVIPIK